MALTGRAAFVAALGVLVVGFLVPSWIGLVAVQLPLLFAILYDLARAAPARSARFTRSAQHSVQTGSHTDVDLTVENPSGRPMRALVRDAWPPSTLPGQPSPQQPRHRLLVPPGEQRRLTTRLLPTRRGDHHAHPVTIRSYGPLGVAARQSDHTVECTVRALPAFHSRRHLPSRLDRLRELDGRTNILAAGAGTEFDSLRHYVPGDDTRSIDWRATARQPQPVVRTWRPERDRRILLVLDTGRTAAVRAGQLPCLDTYLDASLLLTALAAKAGDRADLLAHDRQVRATVSARGAATALPTIVSALAPLEAELVETDPRALAAAALHAGRRSSLLVLFTGLESAGFEEGLLPFLPRLTTDHTVVLASVADPQLAEMAQQRGSAEAVYRAAAAERALAERRRTVRQLSAQGVIVIDETPDRLAPRLADTYLALKAAGRL
ncbi:DUF58 domain-containing protein [Streptomyces sp. XM4193]|uniref:DUF58 domain-containing protein n=1 Tax=Streptomyces sp. XM4193 TaxID=2929782 RepID=UPI001FFC1AE3|nr:DUF58 domain-containing protein [Streptomyces sp. XM4193]MCK1799170.1 DUF58 domain-containing protein [Streptomyces sp. XM4193]